MAIFSWTQHRFPGTKAQHDVSAVAGFCPSVALLKVSLLFFLVSSEAAAVDGLQMRAEDALQPDRVPPRGSRSRDSCGAGEKYLYAADMRGENTQGAPRNTEGEEGEEPEDNGKFVLHMMQQRKLSGPRDRRDDGSGTSVEEADGEEESWFERVMNAPFPELFATELSAENFDDFLIQSSEGFALVDFYAPWCPHCVHFAPDYERLAAGIKRFNEKSGGDCGEDDLCIFAATVDCVQNADLCEEFKIQSYPTLRFGRRTDWIDHDKRKEELDTVDVEGERTAEAVADWIETKTEHGVQLSKDGLLPNRDEFKTLLHSGGAPGGSAFQGGASGGASGGIASKPAVDLWDVKLGVAVWLHQILLSHTFDIEDTSVEPRKTLLELVSLLERNFPGGDNNACRDSLRRLRKDHLVGAGWSQLANNVGDAEKKASVDPKALEKTWRLCGEASWVAYGAGWHGCQGTLPGTRGFTCGLWSLFHGLVNNSEDDEQARTDLETLRQAIWYFFDCEDCRNHFFQLPFDPSEIKTRRDAALWLWDAHNQVNARVAKIEEEHQDGDPAWPKRQWPSPNLCPNCRIQESFSSLIQTTDATAEEPETPPAPHKGASLAERLKEAKANEGWDVDAAYAFLQEYYR